MKLTPVAKGYRPRLGQLLEASPLDGAKASEDAEQLGISVGAVYIARSRVTQKLKDVIATVDESL